MNEELKDKIAALTNGQLTNIGKKNLQKDSVLYKLQQEIIATTPFVPDDFPFFVRTYHITNDLVTLKTCACGCGTPMINPRQKTIFGHKRDNTEANEKRVKTCLEKYGTTNVAAAKEVHAKTVRTNLERYGVESTAQVKEFRDKQKKTCLEKFGTEHAFQAKEVKDKIKKTMIEKHGVESPLQSDEIKKKMKQTNVERYGVENVFQNEEIKAKIVETNLETLGVVNPRQSKEVEEKIKQTCLNRYGVEHAWQATETKEKSKQTLIEHYGVDHQMHAQEVLEKLKETRFKLMYESLISGSRLQNLVKPLFKLEDYDGCDKKYKFECCNCKLQFDATIDDGAIPRCKICYPPLSGSSQMELDLIEWIKKFYDQIVFKNTREFLLNGKELDIYLPEKKFAIELNGLYWHSEELGKDKNYHLNKTIECEKVGIRLIHIFEDEMLNKRKIVYSRIKHILGKIAYSIGARKCNVKEMEASECNAFLDKYHIQGKDSAGIRFGLFYKNRLVAVMTFCKNRIALGRDNVEGEFELSRFATVAHFNIIGAADKLLKHFERTYKPKKILSYADRRWSVGGVYFKLGFTLHHISKPNYWYIKNGKREHRFGYRKDLLLKEGFSKDLTEWEIMQEKGYDRIWDCGNYVFVKEY